MSLKQNARVGVRNMIWEELALVKQNGGCKPRRKKGLSGLFYPPNGLKFSVLLIQLIYFLLIRVDPSPILFYFCFFYSIRVGLSRSELIRPGLAVRVDPVRLLYLPCTKSYYAIKYSVRVRWPKVVDMQYKIMKQFKYHWSLKLIEGLDDKQGNMLGNVEKSKSHAL